jgi:hypothetical protein
MQVVMCDLLGDVMWDVVALPVELLVGLYISKSVVRFPRDVLNSVVQAQTSTSKLWWVRSKVMRSGVSWDSPKPSRW